MKSINQVTLLGHVGRPPRVGQTHQGTEFAEFSLATNRPVREGEGWTSVAEWHNIVAYDHNARVAAQQLGKGDAVAIVGELRTERWEDERGQKRSTTRVLARTLSVLGRGRGENLAGYGGSSADPRPADARPAPAEPRPAAGALPEDVELPF